MAKGRKLANGAPAQEPEPTLAVNTTAVQPAESAIRDVVKVNNANLTELKNACDDALKRVSDLSSCFTLNPHPSLSMEMVSR